MTNDLGAWIRQTRKQAGIKQKDLAHLIGKSTSFISVLERGRVPTVRTLEAIESVLGTRYTGDFDRTRPPHRRSDWRYIGNPAKQAKALAWMRRLRRRKKLTQAELARRACVSYPMVKVVERGKRPPSESIWRAIEGALGETCKV